MTAMRTKRPFAASAPKDGLPMTALRTKRTVAVAAKLKKTGNAFATPSP